MVCSWTDHIFLCSGFSMCSNYRDRTSKLLHRLDFLDQANGQSVKASASLQVPI